MLGRVGRTRGVSVSGSMHVVVPVNDPTGSGGNKEPGKPMREGGGGKEREGDVMGWDEPASTDKGKRACLQGGHEWREGRGTTRPEAEVQEVSSHRSHVGFMWASTATKPSRGCQESGRCAAGRGVSSGGHLVFDTGS